MILLPLVITSMVNNGVCIVQPIKNKSGSNFECLHVIILTQLWIKMDKNSYWFGNNSNKLLKYNNYHHHNEQTIVSYKLWHCSNATNVVSP